MQQESLQLLDWPELCRQVASFTATCMAAEGILEEGLPIGDSQVRPLNNKNCIDREPILDRKIA